MPSPARYLPYARDDFRSPAVAESRLLLGPSPSMTADLPPPGLSLCLPTADEGPRLLASARTLAAVGLPLGIPGLFLAGIVFAHVGPAALLVPLPLATPLAIFIAVTAIFFICNFGLVQRRLVLPHLRSTLPPGLRAAGVVNIEHTKTYLQPKLVGEDIALLVADPANRRFILFGLTHTYTVHADHVATLKPRNGNAVDLSYAIGPTRLDLTLYRESLPGGLRMIFCPPRFNPLLKRLRTALGPPTSAPCSTPA